MAKLIPALALKLSGLAHELAFQMSAQSQVHIITTEHEMLAYGQAHKDPYVDAAPIRQALTAAAGEAGA